MDVEYRYILKSIIKHSPHHKGKAHFGLYWNAMICNGLKWTMDEAIFSCTARNQRVFLNHKGLGCISYCSPNHFPGEIPPGALAFVIPQCTPAIVIARPVFTWSVAIFSFMRSVHSPIPLQRIRDPGMRVPQKSKFRMICKLNFATDFYLTLLKFIALAYVMLSLSLKRGI